MQEAEGGGLVVEEGDGGAEDCEQRDRRSLGKTPLLQPSVFKALPSPAHASPLQPASRQPPICASLPSAQEVWQRVSAVRATRVHDLGNYATKERGRSEANARVDGTESHTKRPQEGYHAPLCL